MSSTALPQDGWRWAAGLLLALLLFSWLTGLWNTVREWSRAGAESAADRPPNILLIVADDLGYNDTSLYNPSGLDTPHLQRLAAAGVTFDRHYADSTCTPSRVAILTGRYPERSGFRPVGAEIPADYPTVAEMLQAAGYRTYLTGKWHAGEERRQGWPGGKGFDRWFGFLNQFELSPEPAQGAPSPPRPTYRNPLLRSDDSEPVRHEGHLTEILVDHSVERLRELEAAGQPWFLYHAFFAPHSPIEPAPHYRARFADTPEGAYAALVTQMDDALGRLLDAIDPSTTLVIFLSDNGGTNLQRDNNYPFFGRKNEPYEGAYRTPLVISWPGRVPQGETRGDVVMNVDILPTILAAATVPPAAGIDGENLLPVAMAGASLPGRSRGWESYKANISALGFGYLDAGGRWRLASLDGLTPALYDLSQDPAGDTNTGADKPDLVRSLTRDFWVDQWEKSLVPARGDAGPGSGETVYSGFDTLRTPFRHGFAVGLALGPLPREAAAARQLLAVQANHWEVVYEPATGLEWHIGGEVFRDASFEPTRCNAVVLTGNLQPHGHLEIREPRSPVRLYSDGLLADRRGHLETALPAAGADLSQPTVVYFGGRAMFSNMTLSDWGDPFEPRLKQQHLDFYRAAHEQRSLVLADVDMMTSRLCIQP